MKVEVRMRFNQSTIDRVNDLENMTGASSKTQVVSEAIKLYHVIKQKAGDFYVEHSDGTRDRLIIK